MKLLRARELIRKPKKPPDIVYGVDDAPPWPALMLSASQQVGNLATSIVVPVAIFHQARLAPDVIAGIIGVSFLGLAVAVLLQALPKGPVGSGYLAPSAFNGLFVGPYSEALALGGLPAMLGMTLFAGLVQVCLSPLVRRLRPYLPPEVAGTSTFLVGIGAGVLGVRDLLGLGLDGPAPTIHYAVGGFTLVLVILLNVATSGLLRMSCVLIGLVMGYVAALVTGLLPVALFVANPAPLLALPQLHHPGFAFSPTLVLPFMLAAVICFIKAVAVITACQRSNDAAYIRPDLAGINRGVLADGLCTALSGLIGTCAFNVTVTGSGLAAATGVTSRRVAYAMAALLAFLAISPAAASVFAAIPDAVAGAIFLFTSCFVITSGVEVMASRLLDTRRMLVVGLAVVAAQGAQSFGASASNLPSALEAVVVSPLLMGTAVALILNLVFLQRARRGSVLEVEAGALNLEAVQAYMDGRGAAWGARAEVISRAGYALCELVDTLVRNCEAQGRIRIEARFNEFRIDLRVTYRGALLSFPAMRPSLDEIAEAEDGMIRLSGFLIRRQTDSARATRRDDLCVVDLHFDH